MAHADRGLSRRGFPAAHPARPPRLHQSLRELTPDTPHELLTPAEMGRADAAAIAAGVSGLALMEAAGAAVARAARRFWPPRRTLVLCGPGNNGGDGYVAARLLQQAGWPVAVAALAPPRPGGDAVAMQAGWRGPTLPFAPAEATRAELVIDAVFGAGLARDLDEEVAETLRAARSVLAVDVPSGLDGGTGLVRGFAPRAEVTVTFFRLKPGHLLFPGRALCGRLVLADIGLPASVLPAIAPRTVLNAPAVWRHVLRRPGAADHKYARGAVAVQAGPGMTGAARLAAQAARRTGAGHVTILAPDDATAAVLRAAEPGVIVTAAPPPQARCLVLGPGLAPDDDTRARVRKALGAGVAVLLDAGALTAFAGTPDALWGAAWITPHAAEFARVFGPAPDRLAAARDAAWRTGAVVVLKGADTIVAAPDGRAAVNAHAPSFLATAGTGDVLAGIVAALGPDDPFAAACAAVWLHGEAACAAGEGLIAEDLADRLPAAIVRARERPYILR